LFLCFNEMPMTRHQGDGVKYHSQSSARAAVIR
jgi:hypothetical protein